MTQNQIRSGGTPRAEKPPALGETPVEEAGDEAPVEEADQELPAEEAGGEELSGDEELSEDEELEEAERPKLPLSERLKRTPPALAILTIAAIGSWGFLVLQLVSRTAPISVLTSSAVVTGLVYVAVTIVCGIATYRAASEGRTRLAFLLAFIGGTAAIVAAVSFAGALVLFLALGF
jgi:hypothetical protein